MDSKDTGNIPWWMKLRSKLEMEVVSLRQKLRLSQCRVQQTQAQLELQKARTKQLVTAWKARLEDGEAQLQLHRRHWDNQLQELSGQLLFLEGQLRCEQRDIQEKLTEKDQIIAEQQQEIQRLMEANERLNASLSVLKGYLVENDIGVLSKKQRSRVARNCEKLQRRESVKEIEDVPRPQNHNQQISMLTPTIFNSNEGSYNSKVKSRNESVNFVVPDKVDKCAMVDDTHALQKTCMEYADESKCSNLQEDGVEDRVFYDRFSDVHELNKSVDQGVESGTESTGSAVMKRLETIQARFYGSRNKAQVKVMEENCRRIGSNEQCINEKLNTIGPDQPATDPNLEEVDPSVDEKKSGQEKEKSDDREIKTNPVVQTKMSTESDGFPVDHSFIGDLRTANGICSIRKEVRSRPTCLFGNVTIDLDGSALSYGVDVINDDDVVDDNDDDDNDDDDNDDDDNDDIDDDEDELQADIPDILSNLKATSTPTKNDHNVLHASSVKHNVPSPNTVPSREGFRRQLLCSDKTELEYSSDTELVMNKSKQKSLKSVQLHFEDRHNIHTHHQTTLELKPIELKFDLESSTLSTSLPDLNSVQAKEVKSGYQTDVKSEKKSRLILTPRDVKKRSKLRSKSQSAADMKNEGEKEKRKSIGKFLTFKF